jgi:Tfp pilus assembly protein FimT
MELLISIAIISVMTGAVMANYRSGGQTDELRQGAALLASSIRRVQTMALAGEGVLTCSGGGTVKTCSTNADCNGGGTCVRSLPKGYGVRLSTASAAASKKAILFADLNGDRAYQSGEEIRTDSISAGPFVGATSLTPVSGTNALDIVLEPPKPTVWFNGSNAMSVATIVLTHSTTSQTRTVTVNRITGQVNADF